MRPDDRVRLLHMIEAGEAVAGFTQGRQRADLDLDQMLVFAVARAVEIFGEAASRISQELRNLSPAVPWGDIVAMQNRVVHAYFDIDHDILWHTATVDIPSLLPVL